MVRVMIVDDEVLIREGLKRLIDAFDGMHVVSACVGDKAVDEVTQQRPDLVLLDIRMPGRDGLAVLSDLCAMERPPVVAMLTTFDAEEHLSAALRGGAAGFLLKDTAPEQLEYAIRELCQGGSVIAPRVARTVVNGYVNNERRMSGNERVSPNTHVPCDIGVGTNSVIPEPRDTAEELTAREREVLELLAQGLSNTEIGKRLYIATTTVKDHVSILLGKLGVSNRVQAAVRAHEQGLVGDVATQGIRRTA
ncbi:response regulator [Streptomyces wuyuanensis]|uniref:response regulator n=1 Tax=Streptomyces wuyuanensis TaxID=1196353 RepID=UPI003F54220B